MWRFSLPGNGRAAPISAGAIASSAAARSSSSSSSGSRRPFQATRTPPSRSRGEASSARVLTPADGASGDRVVGLATGGAGGRPVLGAGVDRAGVGQARGRGGALDELGLAPDRLDQIDPGVGKHGGEDEAGEPGARADVADRRGPGELGVGEPAEAVGDVDAPGALGIADGARTALAGEQLDHRLEGGAGVLGQLGLLERRAGHAGR